MDQFYDADKTGQYMLESIELILTPTAAINVDKLIKESTPLLYQLSRFETVSYINTSCHC